MVPQVASENSQKNLVWIFVLIPLSIQLDSVCTDFLLRIILHIRHLLNETVLNSLTRLSAVWMAEYRYDSYMA